MVQKSKSSVIGREELAKTYAVIKNCIPGHTYFMISDFHWEKEFPKAWPYETKDEIDTVDSIAKWYSSDPDTGRVEVAKANVTNVIFSSRYKGEKYNIYDIEGGMHPSAYHLVRTSPASQFVAIMNDINGKRYWINGSDMFDRDMPQLLPYEEKNEKEMANKIADTYAMNEQTGDIYLVMVNIVKSTKSFSEVKRPRRSIIASCTTKKKGNKDESGE